MTGHGWVKVPRSWWSAPALQGGGDTMSPIELWLWITCNANWADNPKHSPPLMAGELLTTRGKLAKVSGWTRSRVRSWLALMEREGFLNAHPVGRATVLHIVDFDPDQSAQLAPKQRPTSAQPAPNGFQQIRDVTADSAQATPKQRPTSAQPAPATTEEERTKNQEIPPPPKGAGSMFIDSKRHEWPPVPKKGDVTYSKPFEHIWQLWLDGQRELPATVRATDKAGAYILVREHVVGGVGTPEEIYTATRNYIARYTSGREKVGCYRPARFYRRRAPFFLEHIEETTETGEKLITLDTFGTLRRAFSFARAAALRLGVERPEFNDSDGWEAFTACDAEIQRVAVQMVGEV